MPTIPISINRQPIQGAQYPIPGPAQFGAGIGQQLEQSAQVFERIQAGYDATASQNLAGQGSANLKGALVEAKTQFNDPNQYKEFLDKRLKEVYDNTLDAAPNPQVRRHVEAQLANNRIEAETQAKYGYYEKTKDAALANALEIENRLADQAAATTSTALRQYAFNEYSSMIGKLTATGFLDADKAQARIERFHDKAIGDGIALYARNKPLEFGDVTDQGKLLEMFPGASATQIQRGTEIADRTLSIAQARERQQLADESRDVKNAAYEQARQNKLSDQRIDQMGQIYKWPDETVQELKRINRGLKEDNPYKEQLIADAMESMAKGSVNLADVAEAERKLNQLVGRAIVSADSTEFRRAMNQIKNERNRLTIQNDIRSNQAQRQQSQAYSQDRQRASDIINKYHPDYDGEQHKKTMGTINRELDRMRDDPAGRQKYLGDMEKQFQDAAKAKQNWKPKSDGLRSLGK